MTGNENQGDLAKCGEGITKIEDLAELRSTLEIWVDRAAEAVWEFRRDADGSFWTNSKVAEKAASEKAKTSSRPHVTTTARSYVALQYAHRSRGDDSTSGAKEWVEHLEKFTANFPMKWSAKKGFFEESSSKETSKVNTFDVAHLADFFQVAEYADRFDLTPRTLSPLVAEASTGISAASMGAGIAASTGSVTEASRGAVSETLADVGLKTPAGGGPGASPSAGPGGSAGAEPAASPATSMESRVPRELRAAVVDELTKAIENCTEATDGPSPHVGEVRFDGRPESAHFFATLHALRGLHALNAPLPANIGAVVEGARSFAVEQCFYFQRGATHRQDPLRLAFACSIYAVYGDHVDQDLCLAIIQALHQAQQDNGSWPATHPILRDKDRPWHIASHEVALCLTWLYFQPKIPDSARPLLISMMRRYLLDAVAPTFFRAPTNADPKGPKRLFDGWQDDHTVGTETTVGWATAIICHFLANFSQVLDDWINRRVIEDLDLQLVTKGYIIDDVVGDPAPRWQRRLKGVDASQRRMMERDSNGKPLRIGKQIKTQLTDRAAGEVWPDLPPHAWSKKAADVEELAEGIYTKWTDPSSGSAISRAVSRLILHPIFSSPDQRPEEGRYAGLLPGKSGTRKTSLVDKIASTVMWPKVGVPASLIFAKGFDMMEAQANAVFDRLNHLRRCVIFFDEFEEFFVRRYEKDDGAELVDKQRTIAAFTTSAMLPRLQQLHDVRRCLIFLATNGIEKIDGAIKRRGRFDFMIDVNHPGARRLVEYLENLSDKAREITKLDQLKPDDEQKVIAAVTKALEADIANEEVRFAWVEQLLEKYQNVGIPDYESKVMRAYNDLTKSGDEENPPKLDELFEELNEEETVLSGASPKRQTGGKKK